MKLFHVKKEGVELQQGVNYYPLKDRNSVGFVVLVGLWVFRVRYSKIAKRVFVKLYKAEEL